MASLSQSPPSQPSLPDRKSGSAGEETAPSRVGPRLAYRAALGRYKGSRLAAIRLAQGAPPESTRIRPVASADEITEHLDQGAAVLALIARLAPGSRMALSVFALTERPSLSLAGLIHALGILGAEPAPAIVRLLELGLVVVDPGPEMGLADDFQLIVDHPNSAQFRLWIHPAILNVVRTTRPEPGLPRRAVDVSQIRESDGLEAILRLGALWQRVGAEPLRHTHQGTLYKRDRERVEEDVVLTGAIADALATLPESAVLWLALARRVGLIELDSAGERLEAAGAEFWSDNAVHLPQMIAAGWMAVESWQESEGAALARMGVPLAVPYMRVAVLLWLATLLESEWVAIDDLAAHLATVWPRWDRVTLVDDVPASGGARRLKPPAGRGRAAAERGTLGPRLLETVLLGAGYTLGLVRAAEERVTGRRVVQLTPLGRYALALGPTPPPRPTFDHFLFVQPNFEMIAYRQGLTPQLVGWLSRFAWWAQIGAALELKLTRESIVHGLDTGSTPDSILERLSRHSQRPLPPGVVDAVRTWATHRERVTYYAAGTLIEFGSPQERDDARAWWPAGESATATEIADRFLLVTDDLTVPFDRLRLIASRDYRRPPEVCMAVEPDGVSMVLDPARSDLLVDAELSRFADEVTTTEPPPGPSRGPARRRFKVTVASIRRGIARGMSATQIAEWYERRTGAKIPAAVRLLLAARTSRIAPLRASRMIVLNLPTAELLDGLTQHPETAPWLSERLGPSSVHIRDDHVAQLQIALKELGIELRID